MFLQTGENMYYNEIICQYFISRLQERKQEKVDKSYFASMIR